VSAELEEPTGGDLVFDLEEGGLYLRGDRERIDALVAELLSSDALEARGGAAVGAADAAAMAASGAALLATGEEYLRLTADGLAKVREFGGQFDSTGALRGYVRSGGEFAGNLTFETVSFGAEQALALQTAAVTLALRSAIADVRKAVEEVQRGVDQIARRVEAREVGEVVGLYEYLESVVAATQTRGHLLRADWDSVSDAGRELHQSLRALRTYAHRTIASFDSRANVPTRARSVAAFADTHDLGGTLKLITIAERALHLWEYLRIEHVRVNDPDHVESALEDARTSLRTNRDRDRELIDEATRKLAALREIGPLEVHRVISIPELQRSAAAALDVLTDFATVSRTDLPDLDRTLYRPGLSDTQAELKRQAIGVRDGAKQIAGKVTEPLRTRKK